MSYRPILFLVVVLLFANACSRISFKEDVLLGFHYKVVNYENLEGWEKADIFSSKAALQKTCKKIFLYDDDANIKISNIKIKIKNYKKYCLEIIKAKNNSELKKTIEKNFYPILMSYKSTKKAHYTGYVELEVEGSLIKENEFNVPIYSIPATKENSNQIPSRKEIDNSDIYKDFVIAYIKDAVAAYFLHIQGSGRLKLADGSYISLSYGGDNGKQYTSIGKILVEEGYIRRENISMQSIQDWMYKNPIKGKIIRERNDRYIFFKFRKEGGPLGASGVELTAGHSAAVDKNFIPYHMPIWAGNLLEENFTSQPNLFVSQDAGSAIKGPMRVDLFLGFGKKSEKIAGSLSKKYKLGGLVPSH